MNVISLRTKKVPIVYEDDYLLVVDKPAGILAVPAEGARELDLTGLLQAHFQSAGRSAELIACHRLDRDTSGVLVFGKEPSSAVALMTAFRERQVKKTYVAFVQGDFSTPRGMWRHRLKGAWPYTERREKTAITHFQTLLRTKRYSVLKLEPITGRTNQLRLQLKAVGYPLVGDRRFSFAREWAVPFARAALHARRIAFRHPVTGVPLQCVAPLPEDMRDFLISQGINYERLCLKL